MTTTTIVIVAVALAALLLLGALAWVARNKRNQHRHTEAETIRDQAREDDRDVTQREALAEETAAKARAAQAEADIKTAQAKGLAQQADGHRSEAAASREDLNERFDHADALDPATPTSEPQRTGAHDEPPPTTRPR
jgi:FtsZ-interacting cell division protein ZipA